MYRKLVCPPAYGNWLEYYILGLNFTLDGIYSRLRDKLTDFNNCCEEIAGSLQEF